MSAGMILLTAVVILLLVIVALPVVGGGICGSVVLINRALRKIGANHKVPTQTEKKLTHKPHPSLLK